MSPVGIGDTHCHVCECKGDWAPERMSASKIVLEQEVDPRAITFFTSSSQFEIENVAEHHCTHNVSFGFGFASS
jgi:hypothetical protein